MRAHTFLSAVLALFLQLTSLAADAHITLETKQAEVGSYYKAVFRVGHGCDGSPIKEIIVHIPEGVQGAKPMPKAGWQLTVEKSALAKPYNSHGKTISEDTAALRWTGGLLPDAWYDEFVVFAKLPDHPGKLYWKVTQICEAGRIDWADLPPEGSKSSDTKTPAAVLELIPRSEANSHQH